MIAEALVHLKLELATHPELYQGKTAEEIVTELHRRPEIVTTPPKVPAPLTLEAILGFISAASAAKLAMLPLFTDVRDKIVAQDRVGVTQYVAFLGLAQVITVEEAGKLMEMLAAEVQPPDVVTLGRSRFELALRFQRGMPNAIKVTDVEEALGEL